MLCNVIKETSETNGSRGGQGHGPQTHDPHGFGVIWQAYTSLIDTVLNRME